jgi:hypothetical protein
MVIYLAVATIYYGGKDEDSKINSSKPIDKWPWSNNIHSKHTFNKTNSNTKRFGLFLF